MKIIGKTAGGFIAELNESDMAALVGETYFNGRGVMEKFAALGMVEGNGDSWSPHKIRLGATIDLAGRFDRMRQLEYRHAELADVAKKVRALADIMDKFGAAVFVNPPEDAT